MLQFINTYMQQKLLGRIRILLLFFIVSLILSGLTAMGVETQLRWLLQYFPNQQSLISKWLWLVYAALHDTNEHYPFIAYGFDWLAFAHLVIATVFVGPLLHPIRNKWVIQFGCIACCMVIPFALIAGAYRGLPIWWRLIDCSFGIVGIIPLLLCLRYIHQFEVLERSTQLNNNSIYTNENKYTYESA